MYWSPGFACLSLIFVLAASTTFDNRCLSWSTTLLRTVDCQTAFDERCLGHHATEAEIEADALASQRRIEALLQEQQAEAAWWDRYDQQEAAGHRQAEWQADLSAAETPLTVSRQFPIPLRSTPRY